MGKNFFHLDCKVIEFSRYLSTISIETLSFQHTLIERREETWQNSFKLEFSETTFVFILNFVLISRMTKGKLMTTEPMFSELQKTIPAV